MSFLWPLTILLIAVSTKVAVAMTYRKEIRNMTTEEMDSYFSAIWTYKKEGRKDGRNYMVTYDDMVAQHGIATLNTTVDQAHTYAAFVIWHSMIVREFELALQSINSNISVPYWDWTIDANEGDPYNSIVFSDDYFGGSATAEENYAVNSSRMAYFPVNNKPLSLSGVWWSSPAGYLRGPDNYNPSPYVTRCRQCSDQSALPVTSEFNNCLNKQNYSTFWACVWGDADSMDGQSQIHAGVHAWAGGTWYNDSTVEQSTEPNIGDVYDFDTSPNDPLWFSHHANLDRLHYYWLQLVGESIATDDDPCGIYYGGATVYPQPAGHNLWNEFVPAFYAYRSDEEVDTLGPMTVAEACYYLQTSRCNYTYPPYDEYDNGYDDDNDDADDGDDANYNPTPLPSVSPLSAPTRPTVEPNLDPTFPPTPSPSKHQKNPTTSTETPTSSVFSPVGRATVTSSPTKAHTRPPVTTPSPTVLSKAKSSSLGSGTTKMSESDKVIIAAVAGCGISLVIAVTVISAVRGAGVPVAVTMAYEVIPTEEPEPL